jgi:hypothetical protein
MKRQVQDGEAARFLYFMPCNDAMRSTLISVYRQYLCLIQAYMM